LARAFPTVAKKQFNNYRKTKNEMENVNRLPIEENLTD
jgi:hypothetical protein